MNNPLKDEHSHAIANAAGWLSSILEMVEALNTAETARSGADDETEKSYEAACDRIQEAPLSIEVREGWHGPGSPGEIAEYRILITWGGPALQLVGNLDEHNQPDEWPRLEYQDWGIPWTEYEPAREHREALQTFARQFYYGD